MKYTFDDLRSIENYVLTERKELCEPANTLSDCLASGYDSPESYTRDHEEYGKIISAHNDKLNYIDQVLRVINAAFQVKHAELRRSPLTRKVSLTAEESSLLDVAYNAFVTGKKIID